MDYQKTTHGSERHFYLINIIFKLYSIFVIENLQGMKIEKLGLLVSISEAVFAWQIS